MSSDAIFYVVGIGSIAFLYGVKALLFRFVSSRTLLLLGFILAVILAIPITWLLDPDWNNPHVYHIAIWIGTPITILTVPCVSFLVDYFRGRRSDMRLRRTRILVEVVAIPVWGLVWTLTTIFIFNWIWI